MRFLDKFLLRVFSIIILALTIFLVLLFFGIIPSSDVSRFLIKFSDMREFTKAIIISGVLLVLFSFKGLFFQSKPKDLAKDGIILENNSGKLVLTKESLDCIITGVVNEVDGASIESSRTILDKKIGLIVYLIISVDRDIMIKDVSKELQDKIKVAMKNTADLDVGEINIQVKKVSIKKQKRLPSPNKQQDDSSNVEEKEIKVEENVEDVEK